MQLRPWLEAHRSLVGRGLIGLLLAVVVAESLLLYLQGSANRAAEVQSAKLLSTFLQGDTVQISRDVGVPIRMQNVRFTWSDKVYIDTGDLAVRAMPLRGAVVNFDDLDSFVLTMQQSEVRVRADVLAGMFNESVFNYPESKLRELKVTMTEEDGKPNLRLNGILKVGLWFPFQMDALLSIDRATNTLVIEGKNVKVLGVLHVTKLIHWKPLQLENLISLPPNNSLIVDKNRMMVKPFGLFPPPRVTGKMSDVTVDKDGIRLKFAGSPIPAPQVPTRNYVYLKGGSSQFGNFRMLNTDILILDQDQGDSFVFSLLHYADLIPRSAIDVGNLKAVRVIMPDFQGTAPQGPLAQPAGGRKTAASPSDKVGS